METNMQMNQNLDTFFTNLEDFIQNEGVIGKPVTHEDKTFLPVVSLTVGYGSGNTASKNQQGNTGTMQSTNPVSGSGNMAGGALGLGAKLTTDAIIVIDKDKISMMQMSAAANVGQLMDKIPQMLGMNQNKQQGQQNQSSGQPNQQ